MCVWKILYFYILLTEKESFTFVLNVRSVYSMIINLTSVAIKSVTRVTTVIRSWFLSAEICNGFHTSQVEQTGQANGKTVPSRRKISYFREEIYTT